MFSLIVDVVLTVDQGLYIASVMDESSLRAGEYCIPPYEEGAVGDGMGAAIGDKGEYMGYGGGVVPVPVTPIAGDIASSGRLLLAYGDACGGGLLLKLLKVFMVSIAVCQRSKVDS
jgi:hypothetical protein